MQLRQLKITSRRRRRKTKKASIPRRLRRQLSLFKYTPTIFLSQDKKKHKDHHDQPMQYSKFLKGAYDSSSEEEVLITSHVRKLRLTMCKQGTRRSAISGQKIKMKVDRTSQDKTLVCFFHDFSFLLLMLWRAVQLC